MFKRRCQIVSLSSSTSLFVREGSSSEDISEVGKGSSIKKTSLCITVLITSNGRLDQRAWFKNDILEDFFSRLSGVHTLR